MINIKDIPITTTWVDYPDNISLAILVYFYGCNNNCSNCHNPFFRGYENKYNIAKFHVKNVYQYLKEISISYKTNKLVFSGGDPLFTKNIKFITKFLNLNSQYNIFDICIYTGHSIDYVRNYNITGFQYLKCGAYKEELKQVSEKTNEYIRFASENQELYDCNYTLLSNNGIFYFKGES